MFKDIGLQKFVICVACIIAEDNRIKLRGAHLRAAGYEYISERHFGINYKLFIIIMLKFKGYFP